MLAAIPIGLQWIFGILAAIFGLKQLGGLQGVGEALQGPNVGLQRYVQNQPTVILTQDPTTGQQVAVPVGSTSVQADPPRPPPSSVVKDLVNTPSSMWGLAAVGFVGVFVVAQLRAAAHEAGTGIKTVYEEGKAQTDNLKKGGDTANQSRYAKGGSGG